MSDTGPVDVMTPQPLGRLRRSRDVQHVLRTGRRRAGDLLAVHVAEQAITGRPAADPGVARLTVVASRRVGGAVQRNRAKRLLRESARTRAWRGGIDVVLVARPACADSDLHRVGAELDRLATGLTVLEDAA